MPGRSRVQGHEDRGPRHRGETPGREGRSGSPKVAPAKAPAQTSFCTPMEEVIFACQTGSKLVSVCASKGATANKGYVQYRFGKPDSRDPLEMVLPEGEVAPSRAASGESVPSRAAGERGSVSVRQTRRMSFTAASGSGVRRARPWRSRGGGRARQRDSGQPPLHRSAAWRTGAGLVRESRCPVEGRGLPLPRSSRRQTTLNPAGRGGCFRLSGTNRQRATF